MRKVSSQNAKSPGEIAYKLKVLVLENDKSARDLIRETISSLSPDVFIDEAGSAAKAITLLNKKSYTFFFVGLRFSEHSELEIIRLARNAAHPPKICVVSAASDDASVFLAIANGASGYIWKLDAPEEIERLVAITLDGGSAISTIIAARLIACMHRTSAIDPPVMSKLTPKESQIINLAAKGYNFKEISSLMGLKMSTVYTHVRHIYEKLQVTSVSQALNVARQQGLLSTDFSRL
jgi:DNA-binding NarL/FixJ family response regulator